MRQMWLPTSGGSPGWVRPLSISIVAAWAVTLGALTWWLVSTPAGALQLELARVQLASVGMLFMLVVVLSALELPSAIRCLGASSRILICVGAASALAVTLTAGLAPRTSRIFFDEQIYADVGQNMAQLGIAQMCNEGVTEHGKLTCLRSEYNKEPDGFPFLLNLLYRAFGVHEQAAFFLNNLLAGLMVWVVFLGAGLLLADPVAGAWAALVMALIPEQLLWGNTGAVEPSAAFFCAFAVVAAASFVRQRTTGALLWTVAATAWAVQFRPEAILCVPVVMAIVALLATPELKTPRFWLAALGGLVLCSTMAAHVVAVAHNGWDAPEAPFAIGHLRNNLAANARFYVADRRFPALFFVLALAGLGWHPASRRARLALAAYLIMFWGVYIFFYAGSYNYGVNVRYSLLTYPALAMLAGAGVVALTKAVSSGGSMNLLTGGVAAALLLQFGLYVPLVRDVGDEGWAARADVAFAREAAASLPRDSFILTHDPNMFLTWGRNAAQTYFAAQDPGYAPHVLVPKFPGGVYLHWGFWCGASIPAQRKFCDQVLAQFPRHSIVSERTDRTQHLAIYRLDAGGR